MSNIQSRIRLFQEVSRLVDFEGGWIRQLDECVGSMRISDVDASSDLQLFQLCPGTG